MLPRLPVRALWALDGSFKLWKLMPCLSWGKRCAPCVVVASEQSGLCAVGGVLLTELGVLCGVWRVHVNRTRMRSVKIASVRS